MTTENIFADTPSQPDPLKEAGSHMFAIVDCNSFYAACERVFKPSLHGKPVVVLSNNDGCIVSRTDEAKALGIKMAGPYFEVKDILSKNLVHVFSSNYHLYGDMSWRVMETLRKLSPHVEVYSVDESFLDLKGIGETKLNDYALFLKHTVEEWTGIPVSVGIAPTKVLSKIANKLAKKDKIGTKGVFLLETPEQQMEALLRTPVKDVWGVGGRSAEKLSYFGISNAWQLRNMSEEWGRKNLGGVVGVRLIKELKGEPCIEMKDQLEIKKMIATTRMFGKPVYELAELKEAVATYIARAAEKLRRQQCAAKTINVFAITNNQAVSFEFAPKSQGMYTTLPMATSLTNILLEYALPMVDKIYLKGNKYIKAGVVLSDIVPDNAIQFNLFEPPSKNNLLQLMKMIDNVNFSMRDDMIKFAASGTKRNWKMRQEMRSPRYSTRWDELYKVR